MLPEPTFKLPAEWPTREFLLESFDAAETFTSGRNLFGVVDELGYSLSLGEWFCCHW